MFRKMTDGMLITNGIVFIVIGVFLFIALQYTIVLRGWTSWLLFIIVGERLFHTFSLIGQIGKECLRRTNIQDYEAVYGKSKKTVEKPDNVIKMGFDMSGK